MPSPRCSTAGTHRRVPRAEGDRLTGLQVAPVRCGQPGEPEQRLHLAQPRDLDDLVEQPVVAASGFGRGMARKSSSWRSVVGRASSSPLGVAAGPLDAARRRARPLPRSVSIAATARRRMLAQGAQGGHAVDDGLQHGRVGQLDRGGPSAR